MHIFAYIFAKLFWGLLDLLFPAGSIGSAKAERHAKGSSNSARNIADLHIRATETHFHEDVMYSLKYKDPDAKALIWKFKYYLTPWALQLCTYILYDQLVADASDRVSRIPFRTPYIVLHYPSSSYFKGKKKFDHMKELVAMMDAMQNTLAPFFICCTHAILPNRDAANILDAQHEGSRRQRFEWSKKRFVLSENFQEHMRCLMAASGGATLSIGAKPHIYCIDDVVTTGASMHAVSEMLQEKFRVKVSKFCICH